jgi:hypothetical protein
MSNATRKLTTSAVVRKRDSQRKRNLKGGPARVLRAKRPFASRTGRKTPQLIRRRSVRAPSARRALPGRRALHVYLDMCGNPNNLRMRCSVRARTSMWDAAAAFSIEGNLEEVEHFSVSGDNSMQLNTGALVDTTDSPREYPASLLASRPRRLDQR